MRDNADGLLSIDEAIEALDNMNPDKAKFRLAWQRLEDAGKCDGWRGAECERVLEEWFAAGLPADVEAFIVERANIGPD